MLYPKFWRAKTDANIAENPEIILKQLHLCRKGSGSHNLLYIQQNEWEKGHSETMNNFILLSGLLFTLYCKHD